MQKVIINLAYVVSYEKKKSHSCDNYFIYYLFIHGKE